MFKPELVQLETTGALDQWSGSAVGTETTLHQLSPYIGKIKSTMAASLVAQFTRNGDTLYDPFCGSGTVALEALIAGRHVAANDSSPYACLLTRSKLFPYRSVEDALSDVAYVSKLAGKANRKVDLRKIPAWVRGFFHPETLREIIAWNAILRARDLFFLRSCLLGILHHQRPGFLSFPSSHTVPYVRRKKFPRYRFPMLYEYRSLRDRLERKVRRALRRVPNFEETIERACFKEDAARFVPPAGFQAIVTSPPYMRQLNYARDNRLRLWFLGVKNWQSLDNRISPSERHFVDLMGSCLKLWHEQLPPHGRCVLVLGDAWSRAHKMYLPDLVAKIAIDDVGGYKIESKYTDDIPTIRRVRRSYRGSQAETILVLIRL